MQNTFRDALAFNQPIGSWDTSKVTSFFKTFSGRILSIRILVVDIAAATNMESMFFPADSLSDANKVLIHATFSENEKLAVNRGGLKLEFGSVMQLFSKMEMPDRWSASCFQSMRSLHNSRFQPTLRPQSLQILLPTFLYLFSCRWRLDAGRAVLLRSQSR